MNDAPKIDTQAPDTSREAVEKLADAMTKEIRRITGIPDLGSVEADTLRALLAERDLSAEREAAAAMVMREAAAELPCYTVNENRDPEEAADGFLLLRDEVLTLPLPDTTALDRLIAERVREAVEAERARIIEALREAWHVGGINLLGDVLEVARGSKEDRDASTKAD